MRFHTLLAAALLSAPAAVCAQAGGAPTTVPGQMALEILEEAIAVPTVQGRGQVPALAEKLTQRLVAAGFAAEDVQFVTMGETGYLTARYPGRDRAAKPIVVLAHMDVVEADPADWARDPFIPVVEDGFVFGRGAVDNKGDLAMVTAAIIALKGEGWVPARDVVLFFTGDEETQMATTQAGARALSNAWLVLNADAGGGELAEDGTPFVYTVQAGEKPYADYRLTATDPGGHSSRPDDTNPIAAMSAALVKVAQYRFPPKLSPLTKAYLEGAAAQQADPAIAAAMRAFAADPSDIAAADLLSAHPEHIGVVRTTCVPTMVDGGHAPNALPQSVRANINCRIFPGTPRSEVQATLTELVADPSISFEFIDNGTIESLESPLDPQIMAALETAVHERAPGLAIIPGMSAGATDSMHFRALDVPALGVSAVFIKAQDEFAHGLDERLPVATLDPGVQQWMTILETIAR